MNRNEVIQENWTVEWNAVFINISPVMPLDDQVLDPNYNHRPIEKSVAKLKVKHSN